MSDKQTNVQSMSVSDVLALITKLNEQNQANLLEALKEARKPTDYEQEKIDKERNAVLDKARRRVQDAKNQEEAKALLMRSCSHSTPHPMGGSKHCWVAQKCTGGEKIYFVPTCQHCTTQLPKIYCSPEQIAEGIGLENYKTLNMEDLLKWSSMSGNDLEVKDFKERYKLFREAA